MTNSKRILIINTGGTIGMRETERGLEPAPGYLQELIDEMAELKRIEIPAFEIIEYEPLLDSSDMTVETWAKIANDISENYEQFTGFVVLHGTDTMAYTASALAFMLQGLRKPVVLTGAQLPLGRFRNDARENLKTALLFAADARIQEVVIFFGEVLLRGCRATKVSATKLDAFASPNFGLLGAAETAIDVFEHQLLQRGDDAPFRLNPLRPVDLATFDIFPGMSIDILENVLKHPIEALVLKSYGVGNGPANNKRFLRVLKQATDQGIAIVNLTQCQHGSVVQTNYATGLALRDVGVRSGLDMTLEATLAKLMFLLNQVNFDQELIETNLVGELTQLSPSISRQ